MTEEPKVEETMDTEPKTERSIADELTKLIEQLAVAARTAWESEERKRMQADIMTGVQKFGQELNAAVTKAAESEQAKEFKTRATRVAEDVQKTDVVEEVRKGILVGLEAVNRELGKVLERMESKPGVAETGGPVTDTAAGETVVVAETPVVPDMTGYEDKPAE